MASAVMFYDEDCGICRWSADRSVRSARSALRVLSIQSDEGQAQLERAGVPAAERLDSFHLLDASGHMYSAGAALPVLARMLPFGAPVAAVAETFPRGTERVYRWVARHRTRLGRLIGAQACAVDPSHRRPRPRPAPAS